MFFLPEHKEAIASRLNVSPGNLKLYSSFRCRYAQVWLNGHYVGELEKVGFDASTPITDRLSYNHIDSHLLHKACGSR